MNNASKNQMNITLSGTPEQVKEMAIQLFNLSESDSRVAEWKSKAAKYNYIKTKSSIHGGDKLVQVNNLFECAEKYPDDAGAELGAHVRREDGTFTRILILK